MTNELQVFSYNGAKIRATEIDGVPYFVGKDIATVLGYSNTNDALIRHVDEEDKLTSRITMAGQGRDVIVINESGIYSLIFSSKLPEAKKFKHWVTHEVLPQIRQYGMYMSDKTLVALKKDPEAFERVLKLYADSQSEVRGLRKELENSRPYTNLGLAVLSQKGSVTFQSGAQFLAQHGIPIGQNRLFRYCREKGLLCSRRGRQYNKPTQRAIERGLFNLEVSGGFYAITLITPQGLMNLTNMLAHENYPLLMLMETAQDETE